MFRLRTWLIRRKRRNHQDTFLATLDELNAFKKLVAQQKCPACEGNGLRLEEFVRTPDGWDAEVSHSNCDFHGIINSSGFDFKQIHSKGKARRER